MAKVGLVCALLRPTVVVMADLDTDATDQIVPDTKDWTWTLQRPCPGAM